MKPTLNSERPPRIGRPLSKVIWYHPKIPQRLQPPHLQSNCRPDKNLVRRIRNFKLIEAHLM